MVSARLTLISIGWPQRYRELSRVHGSRSTIELRGALWQANVSSQCRGYGEKWKVELFVASNRFSATEWKWSFAGFIGSAIDLQRGEPVLMPSAPGPLQAG
ncbi:MAG: hypothetical protein JWQ49_4147 [Edaphobacter sp.]|nr:hypothetical protein [Edaphobacter sp.]